MARRNSTRRPHPCLVGYAVLTMVAQANVVAIFLAGAAVWSRGATDGLTEHRVSFPAIILAAIAAALVLALTCGALARRRYTAIALSTAGLMASAVLTGAIGWTLTLAAPGPEAGLPVRTGTSAHARRWPRRPGLVRHVDCDPQQGDQTRRRLVVGLGSSRSRRRHPRPKRRCVRAQYPQRAQPLHGSHTDPISAPKSSAYPSPPSALRC